MRLRSTKALLWVLNVVLTFGIVGSVLLFVLKPPAAGTEGLRDELMAIQKEAESKRRVETFQAKKQSDYAATWDANVRDWVPEPPKPPEDGGGEKEPSRGPKLDTFLTLEMIIDNSSTLRYKQGRKDTEADVDIKPNDTRLVRINEKIPGIVPVAIVKEVHAFAAPPRIDVSYGGEVVSLELKKEDVDLSVAQDGSGGRAAPAADRRTAFKGPAGVVPATGRVPMDPNREEGYEQRPGSGMWMIPDPEVEKLREEAGDILEQAEISSYVDQNGKPAGIKLDHVDPDSMILARGFEEGDIIQKVNGQPINSQTELVDWAKRNQDKYSLFRVELLRRGQVKRLNYRFQSTR